MKINLTSYTGIDWDNGNLNSVDEEYRKLNLRKPPFLFTYCALPPCTIFPPTLHTARYSVAVQCREHDSDSIGD